ncbi:MAG: hypothetical protein QM737_21670 [Ferruginibacter sp.]|jgi:hypothetical protein
MKPNYTQQEILLFIKTHFSSRHLDKKDENGNERKLSERELLEEACWNGLIWETLPEICEWANNRSLTLWAINEADSFLDLLFGEFKDRGEKAFSVNPYVFMQIQHFN